MKKGTDSKKSAQSFLGRIKQRIVGVYHQSSSKFVPRLKKSAHKLDKIIKKEPLIGFGLILTLLLIIIITGNTLRKPADNNTEEIKAPKSVKTFTIGTAPRITVNAKVEKSGVITIKAQNSGIVTDIYCVEGETIGQGKALLRLGTTYQGGNALSIQRQIAQKTLETNESTFATQQELIAKQKEIAEQTENNDEQLRDITQKSFDETKGLISLNESTISILDELIDITESATTPTTTAEKEKIAALKQQKSGLLNGVNAAKAALRNSEYASDDDKNPAKLADLSKDVTLKQLDIQSKQLLLNLEISRLQLQLTRINEGLMFPAAPFTGVVERVHVKVGQQVNPGDPIATISGFDSAISAVAFVSENIAKNISTIEEHTLAINNEQIQILPTYISTEPTNGRQFAILYNLPENLSVKTSQDSFVQVSIPIGYAGSSAAIPFIPIDSVYQSQSENYIYILKNGLAEAKKVTLGPIFGSFVEITDGLSAKDVVILDRSVSSGEEVQSL